MDDTKTAVDSPKKTDRDHDHGDHKHAGDSHEAHDHSPDEHEHEHEHDHGHAEHDHGHDEHDHGHDEHDHGHSHDEHDHDHGHDEHDHGHSHDEHDHDHGHDEHDHGHDEHDPGHSHAEHDHGHGHDHHDHGHDHHDHDHAHQERDHGTRSAKGGGNACQLDLQFLLPGETDEQGRFSELAYRLESHRAVSEVHRRTDGDYPEVCIHFDAHGTSLNQILELARSTGAEVRQRYKMGEWFIRGMDAPQCGRVIEYSLARMNGVLQADVAYGAERLIVEYDSDAIDEDDLADRVDALGYHLDPIEQHACQHHHHGGGLGAKLQMPLVILSGILIAVGFGVDKLADAPPIVSTVLYAVALVAGGFFSIKGAIHSLRQLRFDIETLMILSGAGAAALGAWLPGAFLLFLFSLGHALEHKAMSRARNALNELGKLRPDTARILVDGDFVETPVSEVTRGDRMLVRPGDRVALDGTIADGQSSLDEAAVTGESIPVAKGPGDEVFAGTINADSALEIEVTKLSGESVISRVVDMVAQAEARKSDTQRFTQTLEEKFVPLVLVVAVVYPVILYLAMDTALKDAVLRGVSLLVAASPCALAISVPAAVLSAVAAAAKKGILIKGGVHLEALGKAEAMAFDKTGTLTEGKPKLTSVIAAADVSEKDLLQTAAAAEALSSHPLGRAILDGAADRGIDFEEADNLKAVHGKGIVAHADDHTITIGNAAMFDDDIPDELGSQMQRLHAAGETTMVVRRDDAFLGIIGVADTLRAEAAAMVASVKEMGVKKTMLLTGDNARVAQAIGNQVGIDEVHGPLLPEEKVATMERLARDSQVAMTGDGVNDAPALASASVGIAMGGAGTDVALETADVVLMSDKLSNLPEALRLSRKATGVIKQNLVIALGVSALLIVAVIAGWAAVTEAIVLHEGSTILVALNGIRLLRE